MPTFSVAPKPRFCFNAELLRIVDADTIDFLADVGFELGITKRVRLTFLDAPEPRGPERAAGQWVADQMIKFIGDRTQAVLDSKKYEVDSFKRSLAEVWFNDDCVNTWLLDNRYAWNADENGVLVEPRDVESLNIPEGIKQQVREALV